MEGESNAINHPVQGGGSILTYATIGIIKKNWPANILVSQVHDSVAYFVPKDIIVQTGREIKAKIDRFNYGEILGFDQKVPFTIDLAIGDNFADLTDITDIKE